MSTRISLDLETRCTVESCPWYHKSMCQNDHSLSPWHSEITMIALTDGQWSKVLTGDVIAKLCILDSIYDWTFDGHNFKFDWLHLAVHGFTIPLDRWIGDSSIAAYVLTEKIPNDWLDRYEIQRKKKGSHHRKAGKHSLKTLAPYFLGVEPFWEVEDHSDQDYALKDTLYTRQLNDLLEEKLKNAGQFEFYQRLLEWTKLLVQAELRGLTYDPIQALIMKSELLDESLDLYAKMKENWKEAEQAKLDLDFKKIQEKYKTKNWSEEKTTKAIDKASAKLKPFNYSSPSQVIWLLRDYLKYDVTREDGKDSTGSAVLRRLSEDHEDVKIFQQWRKANKLLTSFFPAYEGFVVDGAIHPIYNVDVTRTGRTSSQRPNAQQVTSKLKKLFPARPGYKIVGFDAAAIEAKLIAYVTEDPTLYKIIQDGTSIHDFNCKQWFKLDCDYKDIKTLYSKERKATKNVGFALFYNAGFNRIRIALAQAGFLISNEEAKEIHKKFKTDFRIAYQKAQQVVYEFQQGRVLKNLFGRPLSIEVPQDAYMKGFNKLIQSSASDYLLYSANKAALHLLEAGIEAHPILFVHDYVGFEVLEKQAAHAAGIIVDAMTDYNLMTRHGPIKLEVDGGISSHWE